MDTKLSTKITQHLEHNWRFWLGIVYFTVLILVAATVIRRQIPVKPEPPPPAVVTAPVPVVDLDPLNKRIDQLEQELEQHIKTRKALEASHDTLEKSNQRLERRLQAHTEAFKRLCEYVMVITVDKKIVPRQCLPEYKWAREEGA